MASEVGGAGCRLSPFQRLLLIRVLHPQHVSRGMALVTQAQYGAGQPQLPGEAAITFYWRKCCLSRGSWCFLRRMLPLMGRMLTFGAVLGRGDAHSAGHDRSGA
eukprot:3596442-Rhodomonas_salina.7